MVPTVATTAIGSNPAARSSAIAAASSVGPHAELRVAAIFRSDSWPSPSRMTALSIDECACSEQYTRTPGDVAAAGQPAACGPTGPAASRAAASACSVEIDAVS